MYSIERARLYAEFDAPHEEYQQVIYSEINSTHFKVLMELVLMIQISLMNFIPCLLIGR